MRLECPALPIARFAPFSYSVTCAWVPPEAPILWTRCAPSELICSCSWICLDLSSMFGSLTCLDLGHVRAPNVDRSKEEWPFRIGFSQLIPLCESNNVTWRTQRLSTHWLSKRSLEDAYRERETLRRARNSSCGNWNSQWKPTELVELTAAKFAEKLLANKKGQLMRSI